MVMKCFVPNCGHCKSSGSSSCRFFRIPSSKARRWGVLSGRQDREPSRHDRICSCHFKNGNKKYDPEFFGHRVDRNQQLGPQYIPEDFQEDMEISSCSHQEPSRTTTCEESCQTDFKWSDVEKLVEENELLRKQVQDLQLSSHICTNHMTVESVKSSKLKGIFKFYTGFYYVTFLSILHFLVPPDTVLNDVIKLSKSCTAFTIMATEDQLFLVLCKLRNAFAFKDLSYRFGLSVEDASLLFKNWINFMYFKFSSVPIWPHRDNIIQHMPAAFKQDFPCTILILDGTELKIQKPSSLLCQSQTYSDYKSTNTLKGLIGIDPRGSVMFISPLFSGSISDKQLCTESGFFKMLQELLDVGHLNTGDAIMADKGFLIKEELVKLGLELNIPPFAHGDQFTDLEVRQTRKIASHRVHVERAIARIKTFKILSYRMDLSLFASVNQIWFTCAFLTNFMPPLIKK